MQLCFLRAHLDSIKVPKAVGLGRVDKSHCLHQDLLPFKGSLSPLFSFPGRFVQNIRKNTKSGLLLGDTVPRKETIALIRALTQAWWSAFAAHWVSLGARLLQWNGAQVFAIAASIRGGNNALPLTMKCFRVNLNECCRGLFPSECTGEQGAEGWFSLYH